LIKLIQSLTLSLSILFLTFSLSAYGLGWADWEDTTPGGNQIYNAGATTLHLSNGTTINDPQSWYFYKGHVIGVQRPEDQVESYFTANEETNEVRRFKSRTEWKTHLSRQDLIPKLWTRWYNYKWTITRDDVTMGLALSLIYLIPLGIIFAVIFAVAFIVRSRRAVAPNTKISGVEPTNPAAAAIAIPLALINWILIGNLSLVTGFVYPTINIVLLAFIISCLLIVLYDLIASKDMSIRNIRPAVAAYICAMAITQTLLTFAFVFLVIALPLITILLLIPFTINWYRSLAKERLNVQQAHTKIAAGLSALSIACLLLSTFPQSI